jgi:hypothetical protein
VPTHPQIKTNYLEEVWDKRDIRSQRKLGEYKQDRCQSDQGDKLYKQEVARARIEKVCSAAILLAVWLI